MRGLFGCLLLCGLIVPAVAHPIDDVLACVPKSSALCLAVRDLDTLQKQIVHSPFAAWFKGSTLGKVVLQNAHDKNLPAWSEELERQFGVGGDVLLRDIFGDAVVFCFLPGPPEQSIILIKPRSPETAAKFLAKLDQLQKDDLKSVRQETQDGITITIREKTDSVEAYAIHQGILYFATDLSLLKNELSRSEPTKHVSEALGRLGAKASAVSLWIDPRAFDAEFRKSEPHKTKDKAFHELVVKVWTSIDDLAIHADVTDVLKLNVSLRFRENQLPDNVKGVLPPQVGQSSLWSVIPADAILAVAGRLSASRSMAALDPDKHLSQSVGPLVGKDKLPTLLEAIGPDWGLWVTGPAKNAKPEQWLPDWSFALKVRPDPTSKVDTSKLLMDLADTGALFLKISYNATNSDQMDIRDTAQADAKWKTMEADGLPAGLRPSYGVKQGYFLIVSHPDRIAKFEAPKETESKLVESPLIRISAVAFRDYLLTHRKAIGQGLSAFTGHTDRDVQQQIDHWSMIFEAFQKMELSASHANGVSRLTLTLVPVKPLK